MRNKLALTISLLTLLSSIVAITPVGANSTTIVSVHPSEITVQNVNDIFSVDINIANVTNLYSFELKMVYNKTLLDALNNTLPLNHFMTPSDPSYLMVIKNLAHNNYNTTHDNIWFACTLLSPETSKSGSGVLLKVFFKALAKGGPSQLNLTTVKLSDGTAHPIPNSVIPGYVTVLPEFSTAIFIVMLMAATLIAVVFRRTAWLKKRRTSFVAD